MVVGAIPGPLSWVVQVVAVEPGELLEMSIHPLHQTAATIINTRQLFKNVCVRISTRILSAQ